MKAPADKSPEPQRQIAAHKASQQQNRSDAKSQFIDNRTETIDLRQSQETVGNSSQAQDLAQLKAMMNNSPRSAALKNLQAMIHNSPRQVAQRQQYSRVLGTPVGLQAETGDVPVQRVEDDELLQGKFAAESPAQWAPQSDPKPNNTGLPDNLKTGVESLSGMSLDNVKVHYNSSEPAQLNAHAYAQGADIHLGPGQEQHLPHETWHVVQQAQGRVKPTMQMKGGVGVNDDRGLELEADVMGTKALQQKGKTDTDPFPTTDTTRNSSTAQFKLAIKRLDGKTFTEKDEVYRTSTYLRKVIDEKEEFFLGMEDAEHQNIASQVYARLNTYTKLKESLKAMYESTADYGVIDLEENQHLALFYFHVKRQMIIDGTLVSKESAKETLKEGLEKDEELGKKAEEAISGKEGLPEDENSFPVAVLGAGASAAYYLMTSGRSLSPKHTVIIGAKQPWDEERGSDGVINHPLNMIAPEYQGAELEDSKGGLAPRKKFSQLVEGILKKWPNRSEENITEVKKHESGNYFTIQTDGGTYFARKVVVGLGIGKHKPPGGISWENDDQEDEANKTGVKKDVPRMMDMDRFQRAIVNNEFAPNSVKSIAVIGPNAAIDVMSTVLRNYSNMSANPIYWVTGSGPKSTVKKPFFLKGTDNEYVEGRYDEVVKKENKSKNDLRVYKKGVITVIGHDYLKSKVGGDGVEFTFGERAASKDEEPTELKTLKADIVVYGLGPDVGGVSKLVDVEQKELKDKMEPIYDINQHFTDTGGISSKQSLVEYLTVYLEKIGSKKKPEALADEVEKVLVTIKALERPEGALSKKLPSVVGMRLKGQEGDKASMDVIGATAYRFSFQGRVGYDYVSKTLIRMKKEELERVKTTVSEIEDKKSEFYVHALGFEKLFERYLKVAIELSKNLEAVREANEGKKQASWLESTNRKLGLINNRLEFAKSDNTKNTYYKQLKIMESVYAMIVSNQGMLEELYQNVETSKYGALASTHMSGVSNSLPKNIVLGDQLTSSRSSIEALQSFVPSKAAKGVNFVTSDQTVIATHIAASHTKIPAQLADYITDRIVFDRRHLDTKEDPLPRPELEDNRFSDFTLKQQNEFQSGWNEKLVKIAALF